jgi:predicted SAM-dependent methyltransferase
MRVSITVGANQFKNGYLNIDPISGELDGGTKADVRNLDEVVMDSECVEIIAEGVLEYLEFESAKAAIAHWVKKLRHGGRIIISGTDYYEVCKQIMQRTVGVNEFNNLIHGGFTEPWDVKMSHMSINDLQNELKSNGIKILKKRVNGFSMVIEGERP